MKKSILLIVLLISIFNMLKGKDSSVIAQSSSVIPKGWFQLGVGAKKHNIFWGGSLFFRVADRVAFGIRSGHTGEVRDPFTHPWEYFWDITPAVAYTPIVGSAGMISGIVGFGLTGGIRRGKFLKMEGFVVEHYEKITFRRLGVAFELQGSVFIPYTRVLALTVSFFTNLNDERTFSGYYIGIQFREKR